MNMFYKDLHYLSKCIRSDVKKGAFCIEIHSAAQHMGRASYHLFSLFQTEKKKEERK